LRLQEIHVRPVTPSEEHHYQELMQKHHYLGTIPKIGENLRYVATWQNHWVALITFSVAAWKCSPRDRWIGWSVRSQFDRLNLLTNNSRFLILPEWHIPNLGSRVLALCQKRLPADWQKFFGHPVVLAETFVDPQHFRGTVYKAANWMYVGHTQGYRRTGQGYSAKTQSPKMVLLKPLQPQARELLSRASLPPSYQTGGPKLMLYAEQMRSLPLVFRDIPDPRRIHGRRHRLSTILAIVAGATLCGMRGYQAIADWANNLGQKARQRFGCRLEKGRYVVPSMYVLRDTLLRIDPEHLDQALQRWNEAHAQEDPSLAIDGKTMCHAVDENNRQTHVMSVVGHETKICYTQKK